MSYGSCRRYRKPRDSYKYMRTELQQRDAAFKKGSAYLERYCLLLAFAFYLEHVGPENCGCRCDVFVCVGAWVRVWWCGGGDGGPGGRELLVQRRDT